MVVLRPQSEWGHAPPPQTPYSIMTNIPGWDMLRGVREGDMSPLAKVVHFYPRFAPWLTLPKLGIEGKRIMIYLNPITWEYTRRFVAAKARGPKAISPDDLILKCVDVAGHRIYCILFDPAHTPAIMASWGNPGIGISIRGAEELLKNIDTFVEVPFDDLKNPPKPTWTPESPVHQALRERVHELVHHATIDPAKVTSQPKDVYVYPTGMAAVFHTTNNLLEYRPGHPVILGVVFHSTHHHLEEENHDTWKHFGKVDDQSLDEMETWLEEEIKAEKPVNFVIVETPGNPTLDTPDLPRLKKLSEKYGFVLIIDDTVGGFGNIDVFAYSDILLTSLTKSFNGKGDCLGGSIVLNPLSPHYNALSSLFAANHHNELFTADAEVLLNNSKEFFPRTQILNRNAEAMANFLQKCADDPDSPVVKVRYPTLLPSKGHYDAVKRRSTPELPEPGYGCLLTLDFESTATAKAFYDRCGFYPSPHLAGHVTLTFAYNMFLFGKEDKEREYFRGLGVKEEGIRISAGLEDVQDLIDTLQDGLEAAIEAKKNQGDIKN
ncbi:Cystathionine gamma-synthase [Cladobotryum mycophilum]|uniref:Cystathionine gamma-synthase n=1 Tax=Cladobotryum mycophilum TaxID=491253 RepID=A0ABR0SJW1_9HYPO